MDGELASGVDELTDAFDFVAFAESSDSDMSTERPFMMTLSTFSSGRGSV